MGEKRRKREVGTYGCHFDGLDEANTMVRTRQGEKEGGREGERAGLPLIDGSCPLCLLLADLELDKGSPAVIVWLPFHPSLEDLPG